jgi:UDP-glucose 4-epimerase
MRSVLVTGASAPLGRKLVEHLRGHERVESVVGVEPAASSEWIEGVELVSFNADHRALVEFLNERRIDTIIHCGLAPDRSGAKVEPGNARVIDTMRLGAAIASPGVPVRAWVVASSSSVYPASSDAPLLQREDGAVDTREGTLGASILEAEDYARDIAERTPHLNVAILRLQQLVGDGVRSPISAVLRQPVMPAVIGFDASMQFLAVEDAIRALTFAADFELAGVYNVASVGTVRFSDVVRGLERRSLPVLPVEMGPLGFLARTFGLPHVPEGMLAMLRFGHALDTSKLSAAGFEPEHDQAACLAALRRREAERPLQRTA